jgi:hypothetical protein
MTVPELILTYVVVLLGGVCAAAILSEMRRRRFTAATPEDRIFRCEHCGYVYTTTRTWTARVARNAAR